MTTFDPIARARGYHNRMQDDSANARRRRAAISDVSAPTVAGQADDQYLQIVSTLPDATPDQIGRLLYQRRDSANDILYICILTDAGSPKWVAVSELSETDQEIGIYKWTAYNNIFDECYGVAVTASELLVAEYGSAGGRVVRRRNLTTGASIGTFGSAGSGNGQFTYPYAVAVSSAGNIHVTDKTLNRVVQFNSSRTFVRNIGSSGSGNGNLSSPLGICCDSSNNIYVADNGNSRVAVFNSSGVWQRNIGSPGTGSGQFSSVVGVAVSSAGELFAVDSTRNIVQVFTASTGAYLRSFGSFGAADGQFSYPQMVSIDASNNVYVADFNNNRVQKFLSDGTYLMQFGGNRASGTASAAGVACNGSDVYVTSMVSTGNIAHPAAKLFTIVPAGGVEVSANSGATASARSKLNFIAGTGVTVSVADDATNLEAEITMAISPTIEVVTGTAVAIAQGTNGSATITTSSCTGGASANVMLTGGCQCAGALHRLTGSYPTSTTGWACLSRNDGAVGNLNLTPYIVCMRK